MFKKLKRRKKLAGLLSLAVFLVIFLAAAWPPAAFPVERVVTIPEGVSVLTASRELDERGALRSPLLFRLLVKMFGPRRGVIAGDYWFERPLSAPRLAWRLVNGRLSNKPLKLTVPEGLTAEATALLLAGRLPNLATSTFVSLARPYAGRLLPDTYFFPPKLDAAGAVQLMVDNFARQLASREEKISASGHAFSDVIVMASLVEREAADLFDRRQIAGILWKRLATGMPLQVDVDPSTYEAKGLPAEPLANPSLAAIDAVLDPADSPYWFYLADAKGITHYAEDFDKHRSNIKKYLK
jgi:UPF0755 protein